MLDQNPLCSDPAHTETPGVLSPETLWKMMGRKTTQNLATDTGHHHKKQSQYPRCLTNAGFVQTPLHRRRFQGYYRDYTAIT